jgi:hypothetical protein
MRSLWWQVWPRPVLLVEKPALLQEKRRSLFVRFCRWGSAAPHTKQFRCVCARQYCVLVGRECVVLIRNLAFAPILAAAALPCSAHTILKYEPLVLAP